MDGWVGYSREASLSSCVKRRPCPIDRRPPCFGSWFVKRCLGLLLRAAAAVRESCCLFALPPYPAAAAAVACLGIDKRHPHEASPPKKATRKGGEKNLPAAAKGFSTSLCVCVYAWEGGWVGWKWAAPRALRGGFVRSPHAGPKKTTTTRWKRPAIAGLGTRGCERGAGVVGLAPRRAPSEGLGWAVAGRGLWGGWSVVGEAACPSLRQPTQTTPPKSGWCGVCCDLSWCVAWRASSRRLLVLVPFLFRFRGGGAGGAVEPTEEATSTHTTHLNLTWPTLPHTHTPRAPPKAHAAH